MLTNYLEENNLLCLNTTFQKRLGSIWPYNSTNDYKSQIDFLIINKKWNNIIINCRAYNSFISRASDHRILSTTIKLSLRANKKKCSKNKPYDWSRLKYDRELRNSFITNIKNTFSVLQVTSNDESNSSANTKYLEFENHV